MAASIQETIEKIKRQINDKLWDIKPRMEQAGINSIYAFMVAASLAPVAQIYSSGDWATAGTVLGTLLAGVGSSLISNFVQNWTDEADTARKIEKEMDNNVQLREDVKAVLEKLNTLDSAAQNLDKKDQRWYEQALQRDEQRYNLTLTVFNMDGGSVFQERIEIENGDLVGRDKIINNIYKVYLSSSGKPTLSDKKFKQILEEYLLWVQKAYGKARLYGLESLRTDQGQPVRSLKDVFVPLSLTRFQPLKRKEYDAINAEHSDPFMRSKKYIKLVDEKRAKSEKIDLKGLLKESNRLAVIGGAGCGKTTLLSYLAYCLASAATNGEPLPFALPDDRLSLVPLIIPLRYYQQYLSYCEKSPQRSLDDPRTGTLAGFIPWYLRHRSPVLETSQDFFDRLLLGGGCLLMLDGLDEVVARSDRARVRHEVEELANDIYSKNLFIVTAREAGYQQDAIFGDEFTRLDVLRLDDKQIHTLVANWCQELYPDDVTRKTEDLVNSVKEINARRSDLDLPPLVSTPLMTTMVVSVQWGEAELPRERAKLYEAAVRVILQAQYTFDPEIKKVVEWGGIWEEQRNWLSKLGLAMMHGGQAGAVITEEEVRQILKEDVPEESLNKFIEAVRLRGGLFEERTELFQFIHLTFQEFLAARNLAKLRKEGLISLEKRVADPWWRETLQLLYGFALMDHVPFGSEYLEWLSSLDGDGGTRLSGLELAGMALLEIEKPREDVRRRQAERLVEALSDKKLAASAALRARAGNTLARLGDSRFREDLWFLPDEPLLGFVKIPAGSFWMGNDDRDDEKPKHEVELPTYYIVRYPVTVAQFRAFVEKSGYRKHDPDCLKGLANHPVVNVTWHDALAYCHWLDEELHRAENLPHAWRDLLAKNPTLHVTLPSEAEWEKAARGTDGRNYPWGEEFDSEKANINETKIGGTTAVGCFPGGASPYGVLDMSGNVWEWTHSLYMDYPYKGNDGREKLDKSGSRVLRGGAFGFDQDFTRCAYRRRSDPFNWYDYLGFRPAVVL